MSFDRLGEVWRHHAGPGPVQNPDEEVAAVRARAAELEALVRRRDRIETAVALVLLPIFGWVTFVTPHPVSAVGSAILALACVLIPIRLRLARREPEKAQPLKDSLRAELGRIRAQERLLGSVAWWYLVPLASGVILFVGGSPVPLPFKVGYALAVVALFGWLLHLNLRAVRRDLRPVARALEGWLAGIDEAPPA